MSSVKRFLLIGGAAILVAALMPNWLEARQKSRKKSEGSQEVQLGAPLSKEDMEMMKNGAMRNMDKYMASMEAMRTKLPQAMMSKQSASVARGKELFSSTRLSTNGRACATCHPGGGTTGGTVTTMMKSEVTGKPYELPVPSLVGAAATFPKFKVPSDTVITLADMGNNCIMMFMAAKPLPLNSQEARDLSAYVTSLSNGEEVEVGKVPEMMKGMMK